MKKAFFIMLCCIVALSLCANVKTVQTAPVIDGKLDDACWKAITFDDDFKRSKAQAHLKEPSRQTEFAICCDKTNVYVAVRCFEADMTRLKSEKDGSIWMRDSVELFFSPSGTSFDYYHFGVSPNSSDICAEFRSESGNIQPDPYSPEWYYAVGYEKDAWTVEFSFPFSAFYMTRNSAWSATWLVNVTRTMMSPRELVSCSSLERAFHEPRSFRKLGQFPMRDIAYDRVVRAASAEILSRSEGVYRGFLKLDIWTSHGGKYTIKTSAGKNTEVTLKAGANNLTVPCEYTKSGRISTEIILVDSAGRETKRYYPVFVEFTPIQVKLTLPQYRNNFYPGQNASCVAGFITVPNGVIAELTLEGPGFKTQKAKINTKGEFSFDTKGFKNGEAYLTVKAGRDVERLRICKLAPTTNTMTWVENGNLVINGRPTLRRNIYSQGFLTGRAFNERFEKEKDSFLLTPLGNTYLNAEVRRFRSGLERSEAIYDVKPSAEYLDYIRKTYEKNKGKDYLGWYIVDEPECRGLSPIYLKYVYDFIKELDPYHVVFSASRGGEAYINCADWFETHPYIDAAWGEDGKRTYGREPRTMGQFIDAYEPDKHLDKCIGFLPTCFSYKGSSWRFDYPTFDEYVLHTWAAMMHGGKSLWPYAGHDLGDRSSLYNGTRYIFESFEALENIVLHGKRTTFLCENDMEGVLYELPEEKMFVLVNFAATNAVARLPGVTGVFREFRGARTFGSVDSGIADIEMKPLETIVATTKIRDSNLEPKSATEARIAREEAERLGRDNQLLEQTPRILVGTNCRGSYTAGLTKLFDGTREMIAAWSRGRTNAYIEISSNGFRMSFDTVRVWGHGIIDKLEVDARKNGKWVPLTVKSRKSEKYMHEVVLAEPVSAIKIRLRFPGKRHQRNNLEIYEIELPRLQGGDSSISYKKPRKVGDEGMSLVWDGSNCPNSPKFSYAAWYPGDVAKARENGGFTLCKSGIRYLPVKPRDKWLVFDIAGFTPTADRGYRAWFSSLMNVCFIGRTVSHPKPGIYTVQLPEFEKESRYPLRMDIYGVTVDFNSVKLGKKPADRVEVSTTTPGGVAPGSVISLRAHLSESCEEVTARFVTMPKTGNMIAFPLNGTSVVEMKCLDGKGHVWGADIPVKSCRTSGERSVWIEVQPLGREDARALFGCVVQKFSAEKLD